VVVAFVAGRRRDTVVIIGPRALMEGFIDERGAERFGRVHAEALRRIDAVENEVYHAGVEMPLLRSGLGQREATERASEMTTPLVGLLDEAVMAACRR
jgi:hypothetical protein